MKKKKEIIVSIPVVQPPYIVKTLFVSTGHMRYVDAFYLDHFHKVMPETEKPQFPFLQNMNYGYLLCVDEASLIDAHMLHFSSDLINVLKFAKELNCEYVNFDSDGPICDKLPQFHW